MGPQEILEQTRQAISDYAGADADERFYANRFVFARLQMDERRAKIQIKKHLFETQAKCPHCGETFQQRSGIHLHRIDATGAYSIGNCALMHAACHRESHKTTPSRQRAARHKSATMCMVSRRYAGEAFLYWWDISPCFLDRMNGYEAIDFIKKDSGERCTVPIPALKGYLTQQRQTGCHKGNWGIRVLTDREDELAFEPGTADNKWLFLPVLWRVATTDE